MKIKKYILLAFMVFGCSTTELVDSWKNPDIDSFRPHKVLLVGMTSNEKAREKFESQLKEELVSRQIEAVKSIDFFKTSFTSEKKTEEDLKAMENKLLDDGFDSVLLTKVIGVEDKIAYKSNYRKFDKTDVKFREDYLRYQDAFYNPDYYEEYTIYHTETSMFCICPNEERELLWKGYIDVTDPESINETVNDYIRLVIVVLEEQNLINTFLADEEHIEEAIQ